MNTRELFIRLDQRRIDTEKRTVDATLSTETPVKRFGFNEILEHSENAIVFERARQGLPLLFGHDQHQLVGRVENVRLEGSKLRGTFHFSDNAKASEVWRDVVSGFLRDVSIGYRIHEESDNGADEITVTKWEPFEASVVTVAADTEAGINRSAKREDAKVTATSDNGAAATGGADQDDFEKTNVRSIERGREQGVKQERKRVADIGRKFDAFRHIDGVSDLEQDCIDGGNTAERAAERLLRYLAEENANSQPELNAGRPDREKVQRNQYGQYQAGETHQSKVMLGMQRALMVRCNLTHDWKPEDVRKERAESEFMGMTLSEMARAWLQASNQSLAGLDRFAIMGRALTLRDVTETAFQHTVASFPALLEDVANKSLLRGYDEIPESWRMWCTIGNLSDFKQSNRPNLSTYPTPPVVDENSPFPLAQMSDWKEINVLQTVGSRFSITRQALINDDLDAFSRVPRAQGRAAARAVGDSVYARLTVLYNMQDGNPLFDAVNHNNVYAAGGPSVSTVDEIRVGMALQQDPTGTALGINAAKLICPKALEGTATTLRNSQFDPDTAEASGNVAGNRPNSVAGTFDVVVEHRLDADSATKWYMSADPAINDTIEVAFLNGVDAPMLESRDGFTIDGTEMKVRLDFGTGPLDWRTIALNGTAPI